MYATNVLSTMSLFATGNLEKHIVGGTSRTTTGCKKSSPSRREISVSHSPEHILLKMKHFQYCYELIWTKVPFSPITSSAYGTEYLVQKWIDPESV